MTPAVVIVSSTLGLHQGLVRKRPKVDATWAAGLSATLSEWEDSLDDTL